MKILFLAANPPGTERLDLDKEISKIDDGLQRSKLRDQFHLISKWAVDSNALRRALLEEKPDIVHFSGHGEGQAGLVLVGQNGEPKPATVEALSGLFRLFPEIKCVLLNACYAEAQAKAIVQHIDYVIGMRQAVRDDAAIAFATGFYDGLGYGKSIDVAFELGRNAIQFELASFSSTTRSRKLIPVDFERVESISDHLIPVLLKKKTGSTGSSTNPTPSSVEATSLSEKLRTNDDISRTDALSKYRERVQEFLADLKLTQIEKFQLGILANVLGLSEADANQILEEEQKRIESTQFRQNYPNNEVERFTPPLSSSKLLVFLKGIAVVLVVGVALVGVAHLITSNSSQEQNSSQEPMKVYARYGEGDPETVSFTNNKGRAVRINFTAEGEWVAIPDKPENENLSARGSLSADGYRKFENNPDVPCPKFALGALVVKGAGSNECKASGRKGSFRLEPGETVNFLMNDVKGMYTDNQGSMLVNLSVTQV